MSKRTKPKAAMRAKAVETLDKNTLGWRVRHIRESKGLTQRDLGEVCDTTRSAVSQWESGKSSPTMANLEKLAAHTHVDLEWLRTGTGPMPNINIPAAMTRKRMMSPEAAKMHDAAATTNANLAPRSTSHAMPHIPGMVAELSAGVGAAGTICQNATIDWWRYPPRFLTEVLRATEANLRQVRVMSDSMETKGIGIQRGDYVLFDMSQRAPLDGAVFIIDNAYSSVLRRLRVVEDRFFVQADADLRDPANPPLEIDPRHIIGRAVLHCRIL